MKKISLIFITGLLTASSCYAGDDRSENSVLDDIAITGIGSTVLVVNSKMIRHDEKMDLNAIDKAKKEIDGAISKIEKDPKYIALEEKRSARIRFLLSDKITGTRYVRILMETDPAYLRYTAQMEAMRASGMNYNKSRVDIAHESLVSNRKLSNKIGAIGFGILGFEVFRAATGEAQAYKDGSVIESGNFAEKANITAPNFNATSDLVNEAK